jgi:hypothetical protein
MAKPHETRNHEPFQEHPIVTALLAELQAIEDKARVAVRFFTVMDWASQHEMQPQNASMPLGNSLALSKEDGYGPRIHHVAVGSTACGDHSVVRLQCSLAFRTAVAVPESDCGHSSAS